MDFQIVKALLFVLVLGACRAAWSQNCNSLPPASDFTVEEIARPQGWAYDMAVDEDNKVYWVERFGAFKVWDPVSRKAQLIKQFDVLAENGVPGYYGNVEAGLQGLLLDPAFASNHWIYLWYSVPASKLEPISPHALVGIERLSRFTLAANNTLVEEGSERIIFEQKVFAQCCHHGGALKWGPDGSLYLSTGDNIHYQYTGGEGSSVPYDENYVYGDPRGTSANTADTRGKILRLRPIPFPDAQTPKPGPGSTYEIPPGNLWETWASPEADKVRKEIFTMGHRNPFSIAVNRENGWVAVGEASGDNAQYGEDEINLATRPGFFGWPYLLGNNAPYIPPFWTGKFDPAKSAQAIGNDSRFNTGAQVLPPAVPALLSTRTTTPKMPMQCFGVTWGWVDYDSASPSKAKWPPYLAGKLLVSSYGAAELRVATLDGQGKVANLETLFPASPHTTDILRAVQGPDGAFYVSRGDGIQFGTSSVTRIYRISYKGACSQVGVGPSARRPARLPGRVVNLGSTSIPLPPGTRVEAFDMRGSRRWEARAVPGGGAGSGRVALPGGLPRGMLHLRYTRD